MKQNELNMYLILMQQRISGIDYQLQRYIQLIYDKAYIKGLEYVCDNNLQTLINSLTSLKHYMSEVKEQLKLTCNFNDKHYIELVENIKNSIKD